MVTSTKISELPVLPGRQGAAQFVVTYGGVNYRVTADVMTPPFGIAAGDGLTGTSVFSVVADGSTLSVSALGVKVANGQIGTTQLTDKGVTLAKLLDITTDRLLGRDTAGSGTPELIAVNAPLTFTGGPGLGLLLGTSMGLSGSNLARAALTGAVTAATDSNATAFGSGDFSALTLKTTGPVEIGSGTVAASGSIRTNNGFSIYGRNSFGSTDTPWVAWDGTTPKATFGVNAGGITGYMNSIAAGLQFGAGTNVIMSITSTAIVPAVNSLVWQNSVVTAPLISQSDSTAGSGVGQAFTLRSQSCTGATSTGGACDIGPGAGTTTGGLGRLLSGGTTPGGGAARFQWNNTGLSHFAATPVAQPSRVGQLTDNSGGTPSATIAAIGVAYVQAEVRNAVASLAQRINAIETIINANGMSA